MQRQQRRCAILELRSGSFETVAKDREQVWDTCGRRPWRQERCKLLEAAPGQLQGTRMPIPAIPCLKRVPRAAICILAGLGLTAVTVVSAKSESLALAKHEFAELPGDSEGLARCQSTDPPTTMLIAVGSPRVSRVEWEDVTTASS